MANDELRDDGTLVQAYVRQKYHAEKCDRSQLVQLRSDLMQRVDALGLDAETLLQVRANVVLAEISALERHAILEDAGVSRAVARVRSREESRIAGNGTPAPLSRNPLRSGRGQVRSGGRAAKRS